MIVYRLEPEDDRFHNFALVEESAGTIFHLFDGTPRGSEWQPLEIMAVDTDDELASLGDHALLGTIPVFSERAVAALKDVLETHGELLPLIYSRQPYFAFNVTRIVDGLDEERSRVKRFSSGRIMSVDEFVFTAEHLGGHQIFRIPQLLRAFVFVTDAFVERVRNSNLQGFHFRTVWHEGAPQRI